MEVRNGYVQTEMGTFPDDWRILPVNLLVNAGILAKPLDGNHGNLHPKAGDYVDHGIPFLMANNFVDGEVNLETCKFISKARADQLQKGFARTNDVLLTHKGTIGKTAVLGKLETPYVMLTPQVTYYRVIDTERLNNHFLRHYFDSPAFQTMFANLAGGGTRAYIGIVNQLTLPIVVPPIREQHAIADVLNDVDAQLRQLTRLISKKRDLKRAVVQRLLTGQTRLPGFHKDWEVRTLGDLGVISGAGVDKKIRPGERLVRLVNYMDVYRRAFVRSIDLEHTVSASSEQAASCAVRKGDIFFTPSSEMPYDIAASAVALEDINDACYSYHVVRLRLTEDWDLNFRAYAFTTQAFLDQAARTSEGGGVRYVITLTKFRQLEVRYPADRREQAAIAAILSGVDAELDALEARREKAHALKQGMMQELLTGKSRLVKPESVEPGAAYA